MNYKSTRNNSICVSASKAIAYGISKDGGLFVPEELPKYSYDDLCLLKNMNYNERSITILKDFLTDFDVENIKDMVSKAYSPQKFNGDTPAPISLEQNGDKDMYILELWHGPTSAFKDIALQLLPYLLTQSVKKIYNNKDVVILTATSGDTGKAAMEAFKDVKNTNIIVFYPQNGVSPLQKRQMNTQEGSNVAVFGVNGNFDDAQTKVKELFADKELNDLLEKNNFIVSSANSINWGRLVPQIVYYFSAYCDLMSSGEMDYAGEKVNIVVPSGNFGNILAAYYAKEMGLPVNKIICASNSNNVLTDFINTGTYNKNRSFKKTISPSMDILVSSNVERLIYHIAGGNDEKVYNYMLQLKEYGKYTVDNSIKNKLNEVFYAGFCNDDETRKTIKNIYETENYLCDPHTAVAINVYEQYIEETGDKETPTIIVSTASPYKFAKSVLDSLQGSNNLKDGFDMIEHLSTINSTPIPKQITELMYKKVRFNDVCDIEGMRDMVIKSLGIEEL